jgi:hypothetical protein
VAAVVAVVMGQALPLGQVVALAVAVIAEQVLGKQGYQEQQTLAAVAEVAQPREVAVLMVALES